MIHMSVGQTHMSAGKNHTRAKADIEADVKFRHSHSRLFAGNTHTASRKIATLQTFSGSILQLLFP